MSGRNCTMPKLDDTSLMPFGEYKGEKMINVPAERLLWYYDQPWIDKWFEVKRYIEYNMDVLEKEVAEH